MPPLTLQDNCWPTSFPSEYAWSLGRRDVDPSGFEKAEVSSWKRYPWI